MLVFGSDGIETGSGAGFASRAVWVMGAAIEEAFSETSDGSISN